MTVADLLAERDELKRQLAEANSWRETWNSTARIQHEMLKHLEQQLVSSQALVERLREAIRDAKGLVEGDENDLTMAYNVLDEALNAESEASDGP